MSLVVLASGGLDSTLVTALAVEDGADVFPLFVDYGQRAAQREWNACRTVFANLGFPAPERMDLSGFGVVIPSGLTRSDADIVREAFLPGRNLLFLVAGSSYARARGANTVAIGLLHEDDHLFPDQTAAFLDAAQLSIECAQGQRIRIVAPLHSMHKSDVIALARGKGIAGTYSCHAGGEVPCGVCISCREFVLAQNSEDV